MAISSIFTAAREDNSDDDTDCTGLMFSVVVVMLLVVMSFWLMLSGKMYRTVVLGRQLWLAAEAD